ncbi:MAG: hypothetical protein JXA22_03065 [Candidatus Thermoplasmatota archaeon]|nr:hypothetical protein [Candidatus Thermoplasmatota archaeon]
MTPIAVVHPFGTLGKLEPGSLRSILGSLDIKGIPVMIDLDTIFSRLHLSLSIMQAARSLQYNEARAREPSIEVLRWISGSHQVSRGMEMAGPGRSTERLLILVLPADWPSEPDTIGLPDINEKEWSGCHPSCIDPLKLPVQYGREKALGRLGLDERRYSGLEEMEKAVLEATCFLK